MNSRNWQAFLEVLVCRTDLLSVDMGTYTGLKPVRTVSSAAPPSLPFLFFLFFLTPEGLWKEEEEEVPHLIAVTGEKGPPPHDGHHVGAIATITGQMVVLPE